jgi:hypothetical protein
LSYPGQVIGSILMIVAGAAVAVCNRWVATHYRSYALNALKDSAFKRRPIRLTRALYVALGVTFVAIGIAIIFRIHAPAAGWFWAIPISVYLLAFVYMTSRQSGDLPGEGESQRQ